VIKKSCTIKQLKKRIFKTLRPIIHMPADVVLSLDENKRTEENILAAEYAYFFENEWPQYENDEVKNPLYKLQIHNNTPVIPGFFMNGRAVCEFCNRSHANNCDLDRPDDYTLKKLNSLIQDGRDLCINVHWRQ